MFGISQQHYSWDVENGYKPKIVSILHVRYNIIKLLSDKIMIFKLCPHNLIKIMINIFLIGKPSMMCKNVNYISLFWV